DVAQLLGPADPPDDAQAYLREVVVRLGEHFAVVIPVALHVMMHPSFDPGTLTRIQPGGPASVRDGLAQRLTALARRGQISLASAAATARLLVSLAHDWALGNVLAHGAPGRGARELRDMVNVVWQGLRPGG